MRKEPAADPAHLQPQFVIGTVQTFRQSGATTLPTVSIAHERTADSSHMRVPSEQNAPLQVVDPNGLRLTCAPIPHDSMLTFGAPG
jgi:hypothetical protein